MKTQIKKLKAQALKLNKTTRSNVITIGALVIAYLICMSMIRGGNMSNLLQNLLVAMCYYSIMAVSLNLTVGILGQLSLGHAGFMCIGAFTGAFFSKIMVDTMDNVILRFTLAILLGAAMAGLFGVIIGVVVLRLRGDYLAIVTLAFGEIIKNVLNVLYIGFDSRGIHFSMKDTASLNLDEGGMVVIKGAQGISGTPRNATFTIGVILLIITYLIIVNLVNSRSGRAIMAIRDNHIAAESIGINITKYKILAFSISAALAGVAGVLYSHNIATVQSTKFGYNTSILVLVFVVLGGMGNLRGSIIAAIVLTVLPEYLRFMRDYRMLIYAIVLIVMMIFNWAPACINWRKNHSFKDVFWNIINKFKKVKEEA
ncbi:MAG: branched-chain amino acid ABC transporter permease [Clostridiales bacterium]|jgi:branched-chain amino acid transport system permease protein|nr:branched-chain amino acid ABC transporter permease [Clostridiales bacterium]